MTKRLIRAEVTHEAADRTSELALTLGIEASVARILWEEEQLRQYLEKLRLEDEELERQRILELQRHASITALRRKQELEAETRRLRLEAEEKALFEREAAALIERQAALRAAQAEMRANAERLLAERLRLQEENDRIRQARIAKDKCDIPVKLVLKKRMLLAVGRLK